jgi:2-phospho-L-lactate transferase/gluconeogenesis factor (CofD/UPF0052 family)
MVQPQHRRPSPTWRAWHNRRVTSADPDRRVDRRLQVVLFSGGRGSGALARQLVASPGVDLTIAINGYDDGASTGEVRRFLRNSLGPSDFRKNASTLAAALKTCGPDLLELLDLRLPADATAAEALAVFESVRRGEASTAFAGRIARLCDRLPTVVRQQIEVRLQRFAREWQASGRKFDFRDCSLGNLVFAGGFLLCDREFNRAVDDYCGQVGLREGLIENVTDGTNAYLIAIDADGRLLATEEAIVDASRPSRIRDIYLVDRPLTDAERSRIEPAAGAGDSILRERQATIAMNPRVGARLAAADLIIYGPGTQHSSLFPSYLTPGVGEAIAGNLNAMKVLITNIQPDAEIGGSHAVALLERAVFYLKRKDTLRTPTPFLITHCLLNDPSGPEPARPYVPLGPTDTIEDPRLVRIGNFEEGVTGRHDAARVLAPFIASLGSRPARPRVAVLLYDGTSINKVAATLLEMVRGGIERIPVDATVYHSASDPLGDDLAAQLPFGVRHLPAGRSFADAVREGRFDYALLFESSGMYRGEEIVPLLAQLPVGRLDAVWGSRRLSVRDIEESYRFRYRHNAVLGTISFAGSYLLSVACLLLYGRYISDTLSGVRIVRASDLLEADVDPAGKNANHELLARLLRRKAEILEMPVRFVPLSPERVKRTGPMDGVRGLWTLIRRRWQREAARSTEYSAEPARPVHPLK